LLTQIEVEVINLLEALVKITSRAIYTKLVVFTEHNIL